MPKVSTVKIVPKNKIASKTQVDSGKSPDFLEKRTAEQKAYEECANPAPVLSAFTLILTDSLKNDIRKQFESEVVKLSREQVQARISQYEENISVANKTHQPLFHMQLNQFKCITLINAYVDRHPEERTEFARFLLAEMYKDESVKGCLGICTVL